MQHDFMPVAGESFGKRQRRIKKLKVGNQVVLKRDKHNEYDKKAVVLYTKYGDIGFIPKDRNKDIAEYLDGGGKLWGWVRKLTGGTKQKPDRGVVITIADDENYFRSIIEDVMSEGTPIEHIVVPPKPAPMWVNLLSYLFTAAVFYFIADWLLF